MTLTIQYSLPEETREYQDAIEGGDRHSAIIEFFHELRTAIKYSEAWSPDQLKALEYARSLMTEALLTRGLGVE